MPNTKKTSGANVEKYMLRTEELRKATEHVGEEIQQQGLGAVLTASQRGVLLKMGLARWSHPAVAPALP